MSLSYCCYSELSLLFYEPSIINLSILTHVHNRDSVECWTPLTRMLCQREMALRGLRARSVLSDLNTEICCPASVVSAAMDMIEICNKNTSLHSTSYNIHREYLARFSPVLGTCFK